MQRLFSTFADGLPGLGLFIQRLATSVLLLYNGFSPHKEMLSWAMAPELSGAALGLFILVGLWTPVVGTAIAVLEVWIALAGGANVWMSILLAILGSTLAMIGPGAWSIDARLFGRKYFEH